MTQGTRCSWPIAAVSFSNSWPDAYSGRTISATSSVTVIESTLSLNVSGRSVSDNRTCGHGEPCWGFAARRVSCLVVFMDLQAKQIGLAAMTGVNPGQESRPGPVGRPAHASLRNYT
jgi:hypothetical protein